MAEHPYRGAGGKAMFRGMKEYSDQSFHLGKHILSAAHRPDVFMSDSDRQGHIHVLGQSREGKENALLHWFIQDMQQGKGCAFLDPNGNLVSELLRHVPSS